MRSYPILISYFFQIIGDLSTAQVEKENLENLQRKDLKLRNEKSTHKNKK